MEVAVEGGVVCWLRGGVEAALVGGIRVLVAVLRADKAEGVTVSVLPTLMRFVERVDGVPRSSFAWLDRFVDFAVPISEMRGS